MRWKMTGAALLAGLAGWASPTAAQSVAVCKRIADDVERLRCFDRLPELSGPEDQSMMPRIVERPAPAGPGFAAAEASVRSQLKDPESARFMGLRQRGDAVCGFVNAKNAAGGYTGAKLFVFVGLSGEAHILDQPQDSPEGEGARELYESRCK